MEHQHCVYDHIGFIGLLPLLPYPVLHLHPRSMVPLSTNSAPGNCAGTIAEIRRKYTLTTACLTRTRIHVGKFNCCKAGSSAARIGSGALWREADCSSAFLRIHRVCSRARNCSARSPTSSTRGASSSNSALPQSIPLTSVEVERVIFFAADRGRAWTLSAALLARLKGPQYAFYNNNNVYDSKT